MRSFSAITKPWAMLLIGGWLMLAPLSVTAADVRFSQTLLTAERTATGFERLSSDQVAVIDALVRRDLLAQSVPRRADAPALPARFSARLSADERRNAGFELLTEAELAQLDAFVDRHAAATLAHTFLAPPTFVPLSVRARVAEAKTAPEIHGSFTIGFGGGKGYSERFGGVALTYEDPARGLTVGFSYTESHVKGPGVPYYLRDPILRPDLTGVSGITGVPRFTPEP